MKSTIDYDEWNEPKIFMPSSVCIAVLRQGFNLLVDITELATTEVPHHYQTNFPTVPVILVEHVDGRREAVTGARLRVLVIESFSAAGTYQFVRFKVLQQYAEGSGWMES